MKLFPFVTLGEEFPTGWNNLQFGPAFDYPSTASVSGVPGVAANVTVTVFSLRSANPDDIDMVLVGPNEEQVMLMSDACGSTGFSERTWTFDDAAPTFLSDNGPVPNPPCWGPSSPPTTKTRRSMTSRKKAAGRHRPIRRLGAEPGNRTTTAAIAADPDGLRARSGGPRHARDRQRRRLETGPDRQARRRPRQVQDEEDQRPEGQVQGEGAEAAGLGVSGAGVLRLERRGEP
jgi:hypothetical protein